jgi:hypothetical protein
MVGEDQCEYLREQLRCPYMPVTEKSKYFNKLLANMKQTVTPNGEYEMFSVSTKLGRQHHVWMPTWEPVKPNDIGVREFHVQGSVEMLDRVRRLSQPREDDTIVATKRDDHGELWALVVWSDKTKTETTSEFLMCEPSTHEGYAITVKAPVSVNCISHAIYMFHKYRNLMAFEEKLKVCSLEDAVFSTYKCQLLAVDFDELLTLAGYFFLTDGIVYMII